MNFARPTVVFVAFALAGAALVSAQTSSTGTPPTAATPPRVASTGGKSPHETTSTVIGERHTGNRITVTYGRPYTKDPKTGTPRKIWGGLVPWDKADRLGSDEATLLITQQPLVLGATIIPAGAYTLYTVPSATGPSILAFSSRLGKWGVPVDETADVARVELIKTTLEQSVDQLTILVENDAATGGGVLKIQWETTQFSLPFTVKK